MVRTRVSSGSGSPISTSPRVRVTVSSPTDGVHLVHPSQHVPVHEPLDDVAGYRQGSTRQGVDLVVEDHQQVQLVHVHDC